MKINTINQEINKAFSYYTYEVDNPTYIVVVAHGLAEDAIRYEYFAKKLKKTLQELFPFSLKYVIMINGEISGT